MSFPIVIQRSEKQPRHFVQEKYGFKALEFHAKGFANKTEYKAKHGSDLYLTDIDEYDRICKVIVSLPPYMEPLISGLRACLTSFVCLISLHAVSAKADVLLIRFTLRHFRIA
jgi:hypothetical protein